MESQFLLDLGVDGRELDAFHFGRLLAQLYTPGLIRLNHVVLLLGTSLLHDFYRSEVLL